MQDRTSPASLENAIALQKFGIGQPVRRKEDDTLVRGKGKYTDDFNLPNQAYAWVVRSSHAHGIIKGIDTKAAKTMPAVLGVWTAKDLAAANYNPFTCGLPLKNRDGSPLLQTNRAALASDKVRFVGDPFAVVVAETLAQARDAGEAIEIDIEPLPAVTNAAEATKPGAPQLYDHIPNNVALDYHYGDSAKIDAAFAAAAHVTKLDIVNTRVAVVSMEPRVALAAFDKAAERFTLQVPTQGVSGNKVTLAKILNVPNDKVRILTANVGGSFGMKNVSYPEYTCILHAAKALGRPVKWTDERSSSFLSDSHGRGQLMHAELALDADGKFLAVRLQGYGNLGAYITGVAPGPLSLNSGDFAGVFNKALEISDHANFAKRKKESKKSGKLRGIAVGSYLEVTAPPSGELGKITFEPDGSVKLTTGTLDYGQGHATPFAQVLSAQLGVPFEKITLEQNDSDLVRFGNGTGGSRSITATGAAIVESAALVIAKGKQAAAHLLEASEGDIEFANGRFTIAGTDRSIGIMELAQRVREGKMPEGTPASLDVDHATKDTPSAFPNGCHVAEVEIDPETGVVGVVRYFAVNDFGTVVNPMLVAGQLHGGVAQGIGQALMEEVNYDQSGQPITGSFMDYALPRAEDIPLMEVGDHPSPAKSNPLGTKGCGEAGCAGSLCVIVNAVLDALSEYGVTSIDMPLTPEKIWRAIKDAPKKAA